MAERPTSEITQIDRRILMALIEPYTAAQLVELLFIITLKLRDLTATK